MADLPRPPSSTSSYSQYYYSQPPEKKRAECLRLILNWQGIPIGNGEREKIDINAVDDVRYHYFFLFEFDMHSSFFAIALLVLIGPLELTFALAVP